MEATNAKESLTPAEVARVLNCCRMTVYRMISDGRLPAFELGDGRTLRVAKIDLLAYRDRSRVTKDRKKRRR